MRSTYELVQRPRALNAVNVRTCTNARVLILNLLFLRIDTHVNYVHTTCELRFKCF